MCSRSILVCIAAILIDSTVMATQLSNGSLIIENDKCTPRVSTPSPTDHAMIDVSVIPVGDSSLTAFGKTVQLDANGKGTSVLQLTSDQVQSPAVNVMITKSGQQRSVSCDVSFAAFFAAPEAQPDAHGDDIAAQLWWNANGVEEIEKLKNTGIARRSLPKDVQFITHLPSGAYAYPTPAALTEGTPMQVAVILRSGSNVNLSLNVTTCDAVNTMRVEGPVTLPTTAARQAAEFQLFPVGKFGVCGAGTFAYQLTIGTSTAKGTASVAASAGKSGAATTTTFKSNNTNSIRMRPKYSFGGIMLLGYDLGKRRTYDTIPGTAGGSPTIEEVDGTVGAVGYVGAEYMAGGVDYENMRPWNYFANFFLAVNPASPLNDFVGGIAITPTGGISLAVGVSVHSWQQLKNGLRTGDTLTGNGAVPTRTTFDGISPGFFVGLAVDTNVSDALSSHFKSSATSSAGISSSTSETTKTTTQNPAAAETGTP